MNVLSEKYGRGDLAKKLGYKDAIYVNQLCGGHGSFGTNTARKIETKLRLEHGWMDNLHDDETYLAYVSKEAVGYNASKGSTKFSGQMPLVSWMQAGEWVETMQSLESGGDFPKVPATTVAHGLKTFAMPVEGDSMTAAPGATVSFPAGMLIYVDPEQKADVTPGEFVVARYSHQTQNVTFKQLGYEEGIAVLKPLNTSGQFAIFRDEFEVMGRVIDGAWGGV